MRGLAVRDHPVGDHRVDVAEPFGEALGQRAGCRFRSAQGVTIDPGEDAGEDQRDEPGEQPRPDRVEEGAAGRRHLTPLR
ncbi:hypothetical protein [Microbaculum sp. FT89]|uniref:hypothetical protein n=1 Tax=Microbaculum sp. FT89 TaxID=3447298 RepID=UPI003F531E31